LDSAWREESHLRGEGNRIEEVSRAERIRQANSQIAAKAHELSFGAPIPFLCECGAPACRQFVRILLGDYDALRGSEGGILAPGHLPLLDDELPVA